MAHCTRFTSKVTKHLFMAVSGEVKSGRVLYGSVRYGMGGLS